MNNVFRWINSKTNTAYPPPVCNRGITAAMVLFLLPSAQKAGTLFGEIVDGKMQLNETEIWQNNIGLKFPYRSHFNHNPFI